MQYYLFHELCGKKQSNLEASAGKYKLGASAGKYKLGPAPINTNWEPRLVNTNWGGRARKYGQGLGPWPGVGKYKHPIKTRNA